jgi:hypothetical protein
MLSSVSAGWQWRLASGLNLFAYWAQHTPTRVLVKHDPFIERASAVLENADLLTRISALCQKAGKMYAGKRLEVSQRLIDLIS